MLFEYHWWGQYNPSLLHINPQIQANNLQHMRSNQKKTKHVYDKRSGCFSTQLAECDRCFHDSLQVLLHHQSCFIPSCTMCQNRWLIKADVCAGGHWTCWWYHKVGNNLISQRPHQHFLNHYLSQSPLLTWSAPFFFFFFLPQQPELSASRPLVSQRRLSSSSNPTCCPCDVSAARRYDKFLRMQTQFSTVWEGRRRRRT